MDLACFLVFELVQTAASAAVAKCFPLGAIELIERFYFPERLLAWRSQFIAPMRELGANLGERLGPQGSGHGPGRRKAWDAMSDWIFRRGGSNRLFSWMDLDSLIDSSINQSWQTFKNRWLAASDYVYARCRLTGKKRIANELASEAVTIGRPIRRHTRGRWA